MADGTACIEDPDGLDMAELLRMVRLTPHHPPKGELGSCFERTFRFGNRLFYASCVRRFAVLDPGVSVTVRFGDVQVCEVVVKCPNMTKTHNLVRVWMWCRWRNRCRCRTSLRHPSGLTAASSSPSATRAHLSATPCTAACPPTCFCPAAVAQVCVQRNKPSSNSATPCNANGRGVDAVYQATPWQQMDMHDSLQCQWPRGGCGISSHALATDGYARPTAHPRRCILTPLSVACDHRHHQCAQLPRVLVRAGWRCEQQAGGGGGQPVHHTGGPAAADSSANKCGVITSRIAPPTSAALSPPGERKGQPILGWSLPESPTKCAIGPPKEGLIDNNMEIVACGHGAHPKCLPTTLLLQL
eukprot:1194357-Prorocentrum_minimum.AAC.5